MRLIHLNQSQCTCAAQHLTLCIALWGRSQASTVSKTSSYLMTRPYHFRVCSLETGKQLQESRHSRAILSRLDLNRPTSTELDVASRWKNGGEFRVQFEHKVFEISGGLSPKYIQHLSVHQTKPAMC